MTQEEAGTDDTKVLELYTLAVEMADRVSARRASANTFFFTVQAGLVVALGAFAINATETDDLSPDRFILTLAAIAGVTIAGSWWLLLRSYRDLNTAKFKVIQDIEKTYLPIRLFKNEWKYLKKRHAKRWHRSYLEQGRVERLVPLVFVLLYAMLAFYVAIW